MKIFYSRVGWGGGHIHRSDASNMYTALKAISWLFDRERRLTLVNAVMNLRFHKMQGIS